MPKLFAERIHKLRISHLLTMEEFAQTLGVTKTNINSWENCGSIPRPRVLINISKTYNVSTDYLLGLTDQKED